MFLNLDRNFCYLRNILKRPDMKILKNYFRKSERFKQGDLVILNEKGIGHDHLEIYFKNGPRKVSRVEYVNLSYEKQFVFLEGEEQGLYSQILKLA